MKIIPAIFFLFFAFSISGYSQQGLKTKEDTAFLTDMLRYPQMNVELTISFVKEDFEFSREKWSLSDAEKIKSELKGDNSDADRYKIMAEIYTYVKKSDEARQAKDKAKDIFLKRLSADPSDSAAIKYIAKYFMELGQWNLSKAYYNELIKRFPGDASGYEGIALIEMVNLNVESAYFNLKKAIEKEPGNTSLYCSMANISMYKAFSDLAKLPDSIIMKRKYYDMIDFGFIKNAMAKYPDNENFKMINQGLIVGCLMIETFVKNSDVLGNSSDTSKFKHDDETLIQLNKAEAYFTKSLQSKYKAKKFPYECLMIIEFLKNDGGKSVKYFEQGISNTRDKKELYSTMVAVYAFLWKKEECLNTQLELNKMDSSVVNCMLTAYFYFALDKFIESKLWTQKALNSDRTNGKALLGMTSIALKQKNLPDAQINILKYEKNNPQSDEYLFYKAVFYLMNNSPQIAKNSLDQLAKGSNFMENSKRILDRFYK
jgi:tetratricopeptide (TPR) repeat protein